MKHIITALVAICHSPYATIAHYNPDQAPIPGSHVINNQSHEPVNGIGYNVDFCYWNHHETRQFYS